MEQVLIAFNNDNTTTLHSFFEDCADDIKQHCVERGHQYTPLSPPELVDANINSLIYTIRIIMISYLQKLQTIILQVRYFMPFLVIAE